MIENSLHPGSQSATAVGRGQLTRAMVHTRTRELALRAGRLPPYVTQNDYEQAKRELTGESDPDRQEAALATAEIL